MIAAGDTADSNVTSTVSAAGTTSSAPGGRDDSMARAIASGDAPARGVTSSA